MHNMMAANNGKNTRKVWTKEETLCFLKCYAARQEEFQHSRKRKYAFANVLEDMLFAGYTDSSMTVAGLEGKLKTLLKAYKIAKSNEKNTRSSQCIAAYMGEMDELFGHKSIKSNHHCITLNGSVGSKVPVQDVGRIDTSEERTPSPSASSNRKSAKERYYEAKLALKKEQGEKQLALIEHLFREKWMRRE